MVLWFFDLLELSPHSPPTVFGRDGPSTLVAKRIENNYADFKGLPLSFLSIGAKAFEFCILEASSCFFDQIFAV